MDFREAATDLVREALDGEMDYVVLRGLDDFAREAGDIDVLVPRGRSGQALLRVTERAVHGGWSVAAVSDIGYLTQICLVQRRGENRVHRALKVDFFNGVTWAASGADPLGCALFEKLHESVSEAEAIGLATLLQKLLYAGSLRARDRERIAATCTPERIKAFIEATGLPLSSADLDRGRLSRWSRWRLRSASAGASLAGLPGWCLRVLWRKAYFTVVRSTIPGCIVLVTGADSPRRAALTELFRSLVESAGFPSPQPLPIAGTGRRSLAWRRLRGETVVLHAAVSGSALTGTAPLASMVQVQIPKHDTDTSDDLDRLLTTLAQHILTTLRRKVPS